MAESMYAWSDLHLGGESEWIETPHGGRRKVVMQRNVVPRGEKVTKSKLGVSSDEWDVLVEGGSVRPYPLPEEADEYTSPMDAVMSRLYKGGDLDQDVLMELSQAGAVDINPPAEDAAEVPQGA